MHWKFIFFIIDLMEKKKKKTVKSYSHSCYCINPPENYFSRNKRSLRWGKHTQVNYRELFCARARSYTHSLTHHIQ